MNVDVICNKKYSLKRSAAENTIPFYSGKDLKFGSPKPNAPGYDGESISNQPNLSPNEIHLFRCNCPVV